MSSKYFFSLVNLFFISLNVFAANPINSVPKGPHPFASAEYRLPAKINDDILTDRMTEIWAKVFYPTDLSNTKAPLVMLLHGNHATCGRNANPRIDDSCSYSATGTCPAGYVTVPNHEGYNYIAENLASWGFWVVSINANRGINCSAGVKGDDGLNLARGKLVLEHLSLLYDWTTKGTAPESLGLGPNGLLGKIDFSAVGLFGHSRGGEGIRAAYNLYLDKDSPWPNKIPGLKIKAMFELGAVDGQTDRVLDANGTVWNQLLPLCDGDVSDLEGQFPYERMLLNKSENKDAQKSLYEVWGANHNFFNTEWQSNDAWKCRAEKPLFNKDSWYSLAQQKIALASVPAFFRSRLGGADDPMFNRNFNPIDELPLVVSHLTQIDRDFTPSPGDSETTIVEDFDQQTGINSSGNENLSHNLTIQHITHFINGGSQRLGNISWQTSDATTFFEAVWAKKGLGRDLKNYATLDFRIARTDDASNSTTSTDFSIQLEDAQGKLSSAVPVSKYADINGPSNDYLILKTIRIPLSDFASVDLANIHGVRFIFDKTKTGNIYLANIRAIRDFGYGDDVSSANKASGMVAKQIVSDMADNQMAIARIVPENLNFIRRIEKLQPNKLNSEIMVEITVTSKEAFPVMNRLPVLQIGNKKFKLSRYTDMVNLKELTFTLSENEYKTLSINDKVTVDDGKVWLFGNIGRWLKKG